MTLPVETSLAPMLALLVGEIPEGEQWVYEPKWDGFRCLAFRDAESVDLRSKAGQPLARYFPELVAAVGALEPRRFVLDGEIVVPVGRALSFDDLLQRIHPAETRIRKLAQETPALYVVFDLLVDESGRSIVDRPHSERRRLLERFAAAHFREKGTLRLSPVTDRPDEAQRWLRASGGAVDGVIAKRRDLDYRSGERTGMQKIKFLRTADCVVGGFRYASKSRVIGSLLLGLYDDEGRLDHVGFCSSLKAEQRRELTPKLESLIRPPGFTGNAPGGPSRWSSERSGQWEPLDPTLVVEVRYDHFSQGRFRHGTRFLRWRPDKAPRQCTRAQVEQESRASPLVLLG